MVFFYTATFKLLRQYCVLDTLLVTIIQIMGATNDYRICLFLLYSSAGPVFLSISRLWKPIEKQTPIVWSIQYYNSFHSFSDQSLLKNPKPQPNTLVDISPLFNVKCGAGVGHISACGGSGFAGGGGGRVSVHVYSWHYEPPVYVHGMAYATFLSLSLWIWTFMPHLVMW